MGLPEQWFSNRGQMVQVACAVVGAIAVVLTALAKAPPWVVYMVGGFTAGLVAALLVQRTVGSTPAPQQPEKPETALRFEKTEFVADDREQISYKRKLYVTFRNAGETPIVIGPQTKWKHKDLHVKTVQQHVWQIEGPNGFLNDDWTKEADTVVVPPGQRARTWVGLPGNANKREVDSYVLGCRAGALVTSVTRENVTHLHVAPQ